MVVARTTVGVSFVRVAMTANSDRIACVHRKASLYDHFQHAAERAATAVALDAGWLVRTKDLVDLCAKKFNLKI